MSRLNVLLVRQGKRYGPEYVRALTRQIEEHNDARVITLTDQADTPGETIELKHGLLGYWSKLELFSPELWALRPALFVDLDNFVFASVDPFAGDEFTMVKDFNGWVPFNSCVMWLPSNTEGIWQVFMEDAEGHMRQAGARGDQYYLGLFCSRTFPEGVTSYKRHGLDGPVGIVMQFHGLPKMPDVKTGWVKERWDRYAA